MKYVTSINPATQKVIKRIKASSKKEVDKAVKTARDSLRKWTDTPIKDKIEIMQKLAKLIRQDKDKLSRLITAEMGKPLCESQHSPSYVADFIGYYASKVEKVLKPQKVNSMIIKREPYGVVAVITPWNYPLQVPLNIIVPALLTGNTIVFKPSEITSLMGLKIAELLNRAGLPKGVMNIVIGADEVGRYLVKSDIDKVSFVGSVAAGKDIMKNSSEKLHKLCLELGGKDAAIVCKDADIELAATGVVKDAFRNCGQVCCSIERAYVVKEIAEKFIESVVEKTRCIKVGDPMSRKTGMGPMVNKQQLNNFIEHIKDAVKKGAKILTGGRHISGLFYQPTVLVKVKDNMKMMVDETFGPALPIMVVDNKKEAIKRANNTRFGLTASIWTRNTKEASECARLLEVGTVGINNHGGGGYKTAWGGWKESGFGRVGSEEGIKEFTQTKTIVIEE